MQAAERHTGADLRATSAREKSRQRRAESGAFLAGTAIYAAAEGDLFTTATAASTVIASIVPSEPRHRRHHTART